MYKDCFSSFSSSNSGRKGIEQEPLYGSVQYASKSFVPRLPVKACAEESGSERHGSYPLSEISSAALQRANTKNAHDANEQCQKEPCQFHVARPKSSDFHVWLFQNSMKVMFKCLWKNCEKVLSTSSGIQRHIRTVHLGWVGPLLRLVFLTWLSL